MAVSKGAGGYYSRTANLPSISLWTVMGLVYLTDNSEDKSLFYFGGNPSGNRYALEFQSTGENLNIANTDGNFPGSTSLTQNHWHHIALVCSGTGAGQLLMYLDGELEITADGRAANVAGILRLGGDADAPDFTGRMANWKIWDAALTQAEVQAEMVRTTPKRQNALHACYRLDDTATDQNDFGPNARTLTVNGSFSDAEGPSLLTPAAITGASVQVDAQAGNGSTSVSVPADATGVVAMWGHWKDDSGEKLTGLTLNGVSLFPAGAQIGEGEFITGQTGVGVAALANPDTGSQTLAWTWTTNTARPEGGWIRLIFVRDVDTADMVRAADVDSNVVTNEVSATLATETTDLLLASALSFEVNVAITSGDTFINDVVFNHQHVDVARVEPGASSTTIQMTGENYGAILAISLKSVVESPITDGPKIRLVTSGMRW